MAARFGLGRDRVEEPRLKATVAFAFIVRTGVGIDASAPLNDTRRSDELELLPAVDRLPKFRHGFANRRSGWNIE
jgi:hypothetical protein